MRKNRFLRCLLLLPLLLAVGFAQAQEEKVFKGVVMDSVENTALEKCTITVFYSKKDSVKRLSDASGRFSFPFKTDSALLHFQHVGYTEKKHFLFRSSVTKSIDTFYLLPADKRLDDLVVKAKVPPIVIRGDTTEFHIDSALFEPFDVVDDLVRRLPGLVVDADGKMTFHGKPITRILVDGEELFTGDPNFSMKKLPAGLVAKIQVMDTKTLEQLFNGVVPDGEDKTLNIKLKPGNKTFGSGDVLAGTSNQLEGNATLSQFDGPRRMSVSGSANTSNNLGLLKRRNGPTSSFVNGGLHYNNTWGKLRWNGSYSYNQNGNRNNLYRERTQLITADTSFFTQSRNFADHTNDGNQVNLGLNWFLDSSSNLDANFSYSTSSSRSKSSASSTTLENGSLRNASINDNNTEGSSQAVRGSLTWLKRLNRKGRRLSVNARLNTSEQETDQFSQSTNTYFKGGLPINGDTLDRCTNNLGQNNNYGLRIAYSEPVSQYLFVDMSGEFDRVTSTTDRNVYNLDSVSKTAVYDSVYSARIQSFTNTQTLTSSVSYRKKNLNVSAGFSTVRQQALRTLQGEDIVQDFLRYAPSVNATYTFAKRRSLRVSFSGNTIQPTIEQLQPVPDNSNPLYIRIGNPSLRTAFSQTYTLGYASNNFSDKNQQSYNANLSYAPFSNQIVNAIYYDAFRRQTSQYINASGVYSLRGSVSMSSNRQTEKIAKALNVNSGLNLGQQVYFQNNQQYYSRNYGANLTLGFGRRELAIRSTRYNVSVASSFNRSYTPADLRVLNTTRISLAPQLDGGSQMFGFIYANLSYRMSYNLLDYHSTLRRNDEYTTHQVNADFRFQLAKKVFLNSNLFYQYNTRVPEGTPKGMFNCNINATGQVMKGRGQLVFTAADLFAQSTNLRRSVGENYIEDVQIDNLRNYFTLKFQFNFSKLEKRESKVQSMR